MKTYRGGQSLIRSPLMVDRLGICREFPGATNVQIEYAERDTFTFTSGSQVIFQGGTFIFDGRTTVKVEMCCGGWDCAGNVTATLSVWIDGTLISDTNEHYHSTNRSIVPVYIIFYYTPPAGAHAFAIKGICPSGSPKLLSTTDSVQPIWYRLSYHG